MERIMLITIDTLRADRLRSYGYHRPTSPNLDLLAADGVTFDWALSPASYTGPAHFSIMTSRYPSFHGVQFYNSRLPADDSRDPTLAEVLKRAGFATGAFVGASVLSLRNLRPIARGFDTYDDRMTHHESTRASEHRRWGAETNTAALAWIREHRTLPFFCWIHYMDCHGPYEAPEPEGGRFAQEAAGQEPWSLEAVADGEIGGIPEYQLLNVVRAPDSSMLDYERNYHYYAARYDGGVRYADACLGALIEGLKAMGIYDELLLAVTSDHGEALGENGVFFFHGLTVSMDQIRVPLIMRLPRLRSGAEAIPPAARTLRCKTQVSTLDLAPTILEFADLEGLNAQGVSLLALIQGRELSGPEVDGLRRRVIFSETETQVSATDCGRQVLLGRGIPTARQFPFFHPAAPDSETTLSYRGRPEPGAPQPDQPRLEILAADFARRGREALQSNVTASLTEDDQKLLAHLKALGYVG